MAEFHGFDSFGREMIRAGYEFRHGSNALHRALETAGDDFVHILQSKMEHGGLTPFGGTAWPDLQYDTTLEFRAQAGLDSEPLIAIRQLINSIEHKIVGGKLEVGVTDADHHRSYSIGGASDESITNSELFVIMELGVSAANNALFNGDTPPRKTWSDSDWPAIANHVAHRFSNHVINSGFTRRVTG